MKEDLFALYDALLAGLPASGPLLAARFGRRWALAETETGAGLAMATPGESLPPLFPEGLEGLSAREAARAVKSWNLREASLGLAALNACLNTPARLEALDCFLPIERHYAHDLDFTGKTVGLIGHMHGPKGMREAAREVYIIERDPQPGDYPDPACAYLLPRCDIVLITGSSLVNKTLPQLLKYCENAYTILTGPSVPLCPALLELGIDRLAGLVCTDRAGLRRHVGSGSDGSPYPFGLPFVLSR